MRKLIHRVLRLHWLAIAGIAYWVMLGLQLLVIPHDFSCFGTAAPYFAATTLMLVFGPYLFVVELCDGWVGGSAWWMLKMLPVYLVTSAWRSPSSRALREAGARKFAVPALLQPPRIPRRRPRAAGEVISDARRFSLRRLWHSWYTRNQSLWKHGSGAGTVLAGSEARRSTPKRHKEQTWR